MTRTLTIHFTAGAYSALIHEGDEFIARLPRVTDHRQAHHWMLTQGVPNDLAINAMYAAKGDSRRRHRFPYEGP
jgi:hypothetical protein